MKNRFRIILLVIFALLAQGNPSYAVTASPYLSEDKDDGYNRSLFKHWIDANKNGCDTRAEVLISEAVVKPKVDKKCKIIGGKWLSAYDNKSVTNSSQLDVDHLVPLAEAWRSGAWAWTAKQRQDFANDLEDKRALIAVTLSTNRSKGDKDISEWVPKIDTCGYVENWISIKIRYSLTYDPKEAVALSNFFEKCVFKDTPVQALSGYTYQSAPVEPVQPAPTPSASPVPTVPSSPTPTPTPKASTTPVPTPTPTLVTPTPTPTMTVIPSPTPTPMVTPTPTPSATPTPSKPAAVKYKNCTEARAAGVTPIRKSSDPELYALNTSLDGDKDGDACE
jgi:hypothetical protein